MYADVRLGTLGSSLILLGVTVLALLRVNLSLFFALRTPPEFRRRQFEAGLNSWVLGAITLVALIHLLGHLG